MKKNIITILLIISGFICTFAENRKSYYTLELTEVECNEILANGSINNELQMGLSVNSFQDSIIGILFEYEATHINFTLTNSAKKTLKINWNDMVLFMEGASHPVFHAGVKMSERCEEKAPTSVMKGLSHSDMIIPCDMVTWWEYSGRFLYEFLLKSQSSNIPVKILFPIELNNQTYEYIFTFNAKYNAGKVKVVMVNGGMWEYVEVK